VPGYEASQWYGFAAARKKPRPPEIVDKLNKGNHIGDRPIPGMKAKLAAIGGETIPGSPADFRQTDLGRNRRKWGKGGPHRPAIKPE